MVTRTLAILPAVFIIGLRGASSVNDLLTLSQVVLALQLHWPCSAAALYKFPAGAWASGKWWFLLMPDGPARC